MTNQAGFLLIAFAYLSSQALCAEKAVSRGQAEVRWSELAAYLGTGRVKLVLPDGALIEGRKAVVEENRLVLDVTKSSDKSAHPTGLIAIPRSSVTTITYRPDRVRNRIIGVTTAAGLGGLIAAGWVASTEDRCGLCKSSRSGPSAGAVLGLMGGPAVGGYFAGFAVDRQSTLIRVLPD